MKITVVGAGAVGASCAEYIAIKNFAEITMLVDDEETTLMMPQNQTILEASYWVLVCFLFQG